MLYIDKQGDSVEQVVKEALKELGLSRADVRYEVIDEGKTAFMGIGKKVPAKVRIFYRESTDAGFLIDQIKKIVAFVDDTCEVEVQNLDHNRYKLLIKSENVSHLIGKMGKALQSLQTLVNALLQKHDNRYKIVVDVDQYNKKRDDQLLEWARNQAKKVLSERRSIVLKSLNSYERRLVHIELQSIDDVLTQSKGEGKIKNIKISLKE